MRAKGFRTGRFLAMTLAITVAFTVAATPSSAHQRPSSGAAPKGSDVMHGRFTSIVTLDNGVVTVVPAATRATPAVSERKAAREIWASPALMSRSEGPLGLGVVTISLHAAGVPRVERLLAWVGFARSTGFYNCPAERTPPTTLPEGPGTSLPSNGYAAVVIGAARGAPAVSYVARSQACGSVSPPSLAAATEAISVPWSEVSRSGNVTLQIRALVPPCGSVAGISSGGSVHTFTITVGAVVPDVLANCQPAHYVNETIDLGPPNNPPDAPPPVVTASTPIVHGKLGPVRLASKP